MDINTAKAAIALADEIDVLQATITTIDIAIKERWPITLLRLTSPDEGAATPAGTVLDLLPLGKADLQTSRGVLDQTRAVYSDRLAALSAQLANL